MKAPPEDEWRRLLEPSSVELADTAGLRRAAGLEAEGVERAERWIRGADLVVWVLDATASEPALPEVEPPRSLIVINKVDQDAAWDLGRFPDALRLSAATGEGIASLAATIARTLVPDPPPPGAALPYSPELADRVEAAQAKINAWRTLSNSYAQLPTIKAMLALRTGNMGWTRVRPPLVPLTTAQLTDLEPKLAALP